MLLGPLGRTVFVHNVTMKSKICVAAVRKPICTLTCVRGEGPTISWPLAACTSQS
jgi:hypothetical protein